MVKKKDNKRIDWIDTLRGIAMFFVVWGHSFPSNNWRIRKYIYSFHMPLFFLISGFTASKDLSLNFNSFIKKKVKSLLIPYLFINFFGLLLKYIIAYFSIVESPSFIDNFLGLFYSNAEFLPMPVSHTWFLTSLFLVEVIFYLINKISKNDKELFIFSTICAIISYINSLSKSQIFGPWHIEAVFMGVSFYFLGYMFIKNIKIFNNLLKNNRKILFTGFTLGFLGLLVSLLNSRVSMSSNGYGSFILFYLSAILTNFALILFVKLILRKSFLFKRIGIYSLFYLGYHGILISTLEYYFPILIKSSLNIFILTIIASIIIFPLAMFTYKYCPILIGKPGKRVNQLISKLKYDKISLASKE